MAKEEWRSCAEWLVKCQILATDHKVNWPSAQVFDLAQVLRDGVLICHLLNRLKPGSIDPREFSQRPQMSQFLCLKNIRVFLQTCKAIFGMKDQDLFDPYDLFDMKNFGKVIQTLSKLSRTPVAKESNIPGFALVNHAHDEDIYQALPEKAIKHELDEDQIYDVTQEDTEEDIYGPLVEFQNRGISDTARTKRDYCIKELVETEKNYVEALNMIQQHFMKPLHNHLKKEQWVVIFFGISDLFEHHTGFITDLNKACSSQNNGMGSASLTIPDCFIKWKEKLLIYGEFCSNLPQAQELVDDLQKNQYTNSEIQTCQMKANQGKFRLRDLLSVPMQRVLKYHLLLKELIKQTDKGHPERKALERALEEMQDLSLYVNEVKRDNEALQLINEIQGSIVDLQMPDDTALKDYGRLLKDGELKVKPHDDKSRNRYVFLFDKVMLMCKSRGESYNYKVALILSHYKVSDDAAARPGAKNDRARCEFVLFPRDGGMAYTFIAKTDEIKRKWIEAIYMAQDNTSPQGAREKNKDFVMYSYDKPTTCDVCHKLLRGVFYQGYRCTRTGLNVHKECIAKALDLSGRPVIPPKQQFPQKPTPPVRQVLPENRAAIAKCKAKFVYKGYPPPPDNNPAIEFSVDDVFELISENDENWWEGRIQGKEGFFPKHYVDITRRLGRTISYEHPTLQTPLLRNLDYENKGVIEALSKVVVDLTVFPWFVGQMAREVAARKLEPLLSGTFLIRESIGTRVGEYALSIKFGCGVKHIKVQRSPDGMFYLAECKMFRTITELVDYYKENTLERSFPEVQSSLLTAYKDASNILQQSGKPMEEGNLGWCTAQYDYAANQLNQLSLSVNDHIAILSKAGGSMGWWKGSCDGKTGYFPSAYVTED